MEDANLIAPDEGDTRAASLFNLGAQRHEQCLDVRPSDAGLDWPIEHGNQRGSVSAVESILGHGTTPRYYVKLNRPVLSMTWLMKVAAQDPGQLNELVRVNDAHVAFDPGDGWRVANPIACPKVAHAGRDAR
jgi:hypothetical protein